MCLVTNPKVYIPHGVDPNGGLVNSAKVREIMVGVELHIVLSGEILCQISGLSYNHPSPAATQDDHFTGLNCPGKLILTSSPSLYPHGVCQV